MDEQQFLLAHRPRPGQRVAGQARALEVGGRALEGLGTGAQHLGEVLEVVRQEGAHGRLVRKVEQAGDQREAARARAQRAVRVERDESAEAVAGDVDALVTGRQGPRERDAVAQRAIEAERPRRREPVEARQVAVEPARRQDGLGELHPHLRRAREGAGRRRKPREAGEQNHRLARALRGQRGREAGAAAGGKRRFEDRVRVHKRAQTLIVCALPNSPMGASE
ncbi:MAG: hypothetical protein M0D55_06205 [Elusimicrobiota bacterium]|nr:MAG: hypothetical protein M0D55_06205 [Elusimicrobiota bacterium]